MTLGTAGERAADSLLWAQCEGLGFFLKVVFRRGCRNSALHIAALPKPPC